MKDKTPGLWIPDLSNKQLAEAIVECVETDDLAALTIFQVEVDLRHLHLFQPDAVSLAAMVIRFVKRVEEKSMSALTEFEGETM